MNKGKIKITIYQKEGKTKVRVKKKKSKNSSEEVSNLYLVLSKKITDYLSNL